MFKGRFRLVTLAALLAAALPALASRDAVRAADEEMYPAGVSYDASVPEPEEFLGHAFGEAPVRHHELLRYIREVAGQSERMSVEVIGYSHERRPILFLVVTSPENHRRLDELKQRHTALTEPRENQPVEDDMPVVVWLNYGVHGAESSGMDAALPTVYHLAAARGAEVERMLDESIVLVTAIFNPDGHVQRIAWLDAWSSQLPNADPQHKEHGFNWQFARTNHYLFDLNRQWLPVTQPEPRAWMRKWHEWRPNLTVDYHEMGSDSTYYFHPGIPTRTNPLVTQEGRRLMAEVVRTSEAFLDSEARLWFHGERFDNYYIGKGSTFPYVNGGVGILYEAAAALGVEIESSHGLRTYRENIRKHFRTSLASIEGALDLRPDLLRYQKSFYDTALEEAGRSPVAAWVFAAPGDPARMHHFLDMLRFHRIQVHSLARDISEDGRTYRAGDAFVVPVNQPQYRLIRGIFETVHEFEDTTFYDVSTWTMPLSFGLNYSSLSGRRYGSDLLGAPAMPEFPREQAPPRAGYAYAFEWTGYYAPRALSRILEKDLLARVATKPFTATTAAGPVEFSRGSILVPFDRQETPREEIHELMGIIAREDGVRVHALESGRSAIGTAGVDLGGPAFRPLEKPRVLIVTGDGTNLYEAGEAWHLLDYRMRMPVSLADRGRLGSLDWNRYTHVVFTAGDYEDWLPDFLPRLRLWVQEGGTALGLRDGAHWLRANVLEYSEDEKAADDETGEAVPAEAEDENRVPPYRFPYSVKEERDALEVIGGAIFAGDLDNTHPLGFGYDRRSIALHKSSTDILERPQNPYASVIVYDDPPLLSGYASEANRIRIEGSAALVAERLKEGSVVLFADNPNFRGYWYGTNKLFLNALFFSRAFEPPREN